MLGKKRCGVLKARKAQLAAFIIIGILMLAMGGTIYYLIASAKKTEAEKIVEKGMEVSLDETKIRAYISACIEKEGKELVDKLETQGGTLNPVQFRYYFNVKYNYHCIEQEGPGCVSRLVTRLSMADELNAGMKENLRKCVNFENFRKQGYDVKEGAISVKTIVGVDDVNFEVIYPITITKDKDKVDINDFSERVFSKLGTLYDLAARIVYAETTEGRFDEDMWRMQHGQIIMEKHRPYPDIIYSLKIKDEAAKKEESFNFAIKGRYTIYDIGKLMQPKVSPGYCRTKDNNCYANANQADCVKAQGEWQGSRFPEAQCEGLSAMPEPGCKGDECKGCGKRKNGESWCEYEGPASPGFSLVGSRHYKGSCIDGKIYYTECRDYREEVCVENDQIEVPKAVCRVNRWQDCAKQDAKDKCADNSIRDCYWSDYLVWNKYQINVHETGNTNVISNAIGKEVSVGIYNYHGKCIPYIPPGFAHWQLNGQEACAMANEQFDCPYYTCGQSWVDSTALHCYMMGDCGNYRNTEGEMTYGGLFNLDSAPSDYVYLTDEQLKTKTTPKLMMEAESKPVLDGTEFNNLGGDINQMMNNEVKYFDEVANWKFEDFRQSYLLMGKANYHLLQTSLCMPWQAPLKGKDCDRCGSLNRPCTEYKCRSLGQTCTYEEINGIGFCYDYAEKDKTPPKLFFDGSVYGDFSIKEDIFEGMKGYKVDKPLQPYAPVFFILNASEPVRCKVVGVPQPKYDQIPIPSSPAFEKFYVFTDVVPKPVDFRIGIMKSLGIDNFLEFGTFESYDTKFNGLVFDARKFVKEFEGTLDKEAAEAHIAFAEKAWKEEISPQIKNVFDKFGDTLRDIAIQTEQGYKLVFFKCIDKAGNENEQGIYFKYRIGKDTNAPWILAISPPNNTRAADGFELVLYANEPANCRYAGSDMDYDAMDLKTEMDCISPTMVGSMRAYECRTNINGGNGTRTDIYIRCRDKPVKNTMYRFNLTKSGEFSHMVQENAIATHLDGDNIINLTANWEQYYSFPDVKNINVKNDENEIVINSINDEIDCRYSINESTSLGQMEPMECGKIGNITSYDCRKKVNAGENLFVAAACQNKFEEEERNTAKASQVLSYLISS